MHRERPGPMTYRQARGAGVSRRTLESGAFVRVLHNVYLPFGVPVDGYAVGRAVLLVAQPGAFLSHGSAAQLWGAVVPHDPMAHVSIARGRGRSQRRDVVVHSSSRSPTTFRGLPVTTAVDTFLDCATYLTLVDLVVLGDTLVRRHRTTPAALVEAVGSSTGRGIRLAKRAASLVRTGVDSPMETRARMLRVLSGLPELTTDVRVYAPDGTVRRRLDAADPTTRTAVEYDGRHHVLREEQWEADILRSEELHLEDWWILTLVSKDIYRTPGASIERMDQLFRRRGVPIGRRSQEWRRHFPGLG